MTQYITIFLMSLGVTFSGIQFDNEAIQENSFKKKTTRTTANSSYYTGYSETTENDSTDGGNNGWEEE